MKLPIPWLKGLPATLHSGVNLAIRNTTRIPKSLELIFTARLADKSTLILSNDSISMMCFNIEKAGERDSQNFVDQIDP
jgi:hypothetical protein